MPPNTFNGVEIPEMVLKYQNIIIIVTFHLFIREDCHGIDLSNVQFQPVII